MKNYLLAILIAGTATPAVHGNPLPAEITSGVLVEGAWVRPDPREDASEIFIVLNNRSDSVIRLTSVGWPMQNQAPLSAHAGIPSTVCRYLFTPSCT
jgi:copper(I)-binding protein